MLRGAIVGASSFAQHHIEAWRRIEDVEIVGVADIDSAKAEAFRARWGLPRAYPSIEALLDDGSPDFVDIVTRPESHLRLARVAAGRHTHVICQKPVAPTWDECVQMAEIGRGPRCRVIVHDNWRWQPWYRWARERIDGGAIGAPWHARLLIRLGDGRGPSPYGRQPYFREMPRLLVYETLVHFLDTLAFLLGPIAEVSCTMSRRNPTIAGEDTAIVTMRFESGATAVIDATRVSGPAQPPPAFGVCVVEGEHGTLVIHADGTGSLHPGGAAEHAIQADAGVEFTPHLAIGYRGDSVRAAQSHYAGCLASGQPAETEIDAYLPIAQAVEACYASTRRGTVRIASGRPTAGSTHRDA